MNIVCLSTLGVSTGFVVRELLRAVPTVKLIRLSYVAPAKRRTRWRNVIPRIWRRVEERIFYDHYAAQGQQQLKQLLYGSDDPPPLPISLELETTAVNSLMTMRLLQSLRPRILLTVGAPLLKSHIFSLPRLGTINLHFGLAPWYRGEDTLFWPLYYRDPQHAGITIHQIDSGIDTGQVLAHGRLDVCKDDTQWTLEAKAARLGAELLVDLVLRDCWSPVWQPPCETAGRQFNYKSRHLWHDARVFVANRLAGPAVSLGAAGAVNYCLPRTDTEASLASDLERVTDSDLALASRSADLQPCSQSRSD